MAFITANFVSKCLMRTVTINVILPADKFTLSETAQEEIKPFKTLYLLHGIFGNYTDWVNGTRIQRWAEERNLAVVMPSGDNHYYVDCEATGELYGEFIGKELVEITRKMFRLSDKREDTFIAGLSMGGYGAIRNGLKYHDTFGCIAGLSSGLVLDRILNSTNDDPTPTRRRNYYEAIFGDIDKLVGSDKDYHALITRLLEEGADIPKMYMACGSEDFLIEQNRSYRDFLLEHGIPLTYEEGPGVHDWVFWDTYIRKVIDWLPLEDAAAGINSGNVSAK